MRTDRSMARGDREGSAAWHGAMGEILIRYFLKMRGIQFQAARMLELHPVVGPDIWINDESYDVKTIREDAPDFLVNVTAHEKAKADNYIFVRLEPRRM